MIELKTPTLELLPRYVDALQRDWSPDNIRGRVAAEEQLAAIEKDAAGKETVLVTSAEVADPVAVRYAWRDAPVAGLFIKEGLPAVPFRSDTW